MIRTARERDVSTIGMPFAQHRATSDLDMYYAAFKNETHGQAIARLRSPDVGPANSE